MPGKLNSTYMTSSFCRQCRAAVTSTAKTCPLCGISRPVYKSLSEIEKFYLDSPPMVSLRFQYLCDNVKPLKTLGYNLRTEFVSFLLNPGISIYFWLSWAAMIIGVLTIQKILVIGVIIFTAGLLICASELFNLIKSIYSAYLIGRLQLKSGTSPYSVHFKIEDQLKEMLTTLQTTCNSICDAPIPADSASRTTVMNHFVNAVSTVTSRVARCADLSLETFSLIWRNNVYAVVAMKSSSKSKSETISHKVREAEAFILRYRWLLALQAIPQILQNYADTGCSESQADLRKAIISDYVLTSFGPLSEAYAGNFEQVPFEMPYRMKYFWLGQLPPFPLPPESYTGDLPKTADLFESIAQVRNLLTKLGEQIILDSATSAIASASKAVLTQSAEIEAVQIQQMQLYADYLDIPLFNPDANELQEKVDKLRGQLKVVGNS